MDTVDPEVRAPRRCHGDDLFARLHAMGPSERRLSRIDPRNRSLPDPVALDRWRARADRQRDAHLVRFDRRLLAGEEAVEAARAVLFEYMEWTRGSLPDFADRSPASTGMARLRAAEEAHWTGVAEIVAASVAVDIEGLDRFLRVWLAAVHEAVATGYASLYLRVSG